jgi:hypothetical protein
VPGVTTVYGHKYKFARRFENVGQNITQKMHRCVTEHLLRKDIEEFL